MSIKNEYNSPERRSDIEKKKKQGALSTGSDKPLVLLFQGRKGETTEVRKRVNFEMARQFKHLSKTQRNQLEMLLKAKVSKREIANYLGVHLSTVYREIKRGAYVHKNSDWTETVRYSADKAEIKYREMLKEKGSQIKLGNDYEYAEYLERKIIEEKLSPKAVLGYIKMHNIQFNTTISVNTLYSYIRKGYFSRLEMNHLTRGNQKKKKQHVRVNKRAPKGISIEKRPIEILERITFGHWEMDCVCGPTKQSLLVLTERLTRKEIIMPICTQSANAVVKALNRIEKRYGKQFKRIFKTITVDNGTEFSNCQGIETSMYGKGQRTKVYYCHPYSSWERGTNERINREIRRLIPKGTNLAQFTEKQIQYVEEWVNNYPREIFDFETSNERFAREIAKIA